MDTIYEVEALSNRKLYDAIVEYRKVCYELKYVNYDLRVPSTISLTIPESVMGAWQDDNADMRRFFIYGESLEYDALKEKESCKKGDYVKKTNKSVPNIENI